MIADYFAQAGGEGRVPRGAAPWPGRARPCSATARIRTSRRPCTATPGRGGATVVSAKQLHGKELSYNNLLDLDSALAIVRQFAAPAAVVVKHNNPCGAAVADSAGRGPRTARWPATR